MTKSKLKKNINTYLDNNKIQLTWVNGINEQEMLIFNGIQKCNKFIKSMSMANHFDYTISLIIEGKHY